MNKTHTSLTIDPELLDIVKAKGINMSEVLETALLLRLNRVENKGKGFPFDYCERDISDHIKQSLFPAIKARRCQKCGEVWFVNDLKGEFTLCRECWESE